MPSNSEPQQVGPMNSTSNSPEMPFDDDGVDSLFGDEPEARTRDDSPSSPTKEGSEVNPEPAARIPSLSWTTTSSEAVPMVTSRHALDGHSTQTRQGEINKTSLPHATKKATRDMSERPVRHERARNLGASRGGIPKARKGRGSRKEFDKVKGYIRASMDIEAIIRHVRPNNRRRLSSLRVAQLAIQEKMDSI